MQTLSLIDNLDQSAGLRHRAAVHLSAIVQKLEQAEQGGPNRSGALALEEEQRRLAIASRELEQGIVRLVVLGDVKRGKSTLLNGLLGERILPTDVAPCTALPTLVRYGPERRVRIQFQDGQEEILDIAGFHQRYTIDPEETKRLEAAQELAFPTVKQAIVELPLPLLAPGLEILDTPGLNDTEARNATVLEGLERCHGVLFVLSATQPLTLDERRYLRNYLSDRPWELFFLVNGWDQLRDGLLNPEDPEALAAAEAHQRQRLRSNLAEFVGDRYDQRVFEISALDALRQRLRDPQASLEGTGFPAFLQVLGQYLTRNHLQAQLRLAQELARLTVQRVQAAVERRIPLLHQSSSELETTLAGVQGDFEKLAQIRDRFRQRIQAVKTEQAEAIATSFRDYLLKLELTFETDFVAAQPDLEFFDFLNQDNRAKFYHSFKRAFERYMNDRLIAWEFMAKQELGRSFNQLNDEALEYAEAYAQAIDILNEKLIGSRYEAAENRFDSDEAQVWIDSINAVFQAIPDSLNQSVRQFSQFWQTVLLYACIYAAIQISLILVGVLFSALALNIFAAIAIGAGVVAIQAETVRQKFLATTKAEFIKTLPRIIQEQQPLIQRAVQQCFEAYESQVMEQINLDIANRQSELNNLLKQKQSQDIDATQETERLRALTQSIATELTELTRMAEV